jgi:hypothetical protein
MLGAAAAVTAAAGRNLPDRNDGVPALVCSSARLAPYQTGKPIRYPKVTQVTGETRPLPTALRALPRLSPADRKFNTRSRGQVRFAATVRRLAPP